MSVTGSLHWLYKAFDVEAPSGRPAAPPPFPMGAREASPSATGKGGHWVLGFTEGQQTDAWRSSRLELRINQEFEKFRRVLSGNLGQMTVAIPLSASHLYPSGRHMSSYALAGYDNMVADKPDENWLRFYLLFKDVFVLELSGEKSCGDPKVRPNAPKYREAFVSADPHKISLRKVDTGR